MARLSGSEQGRRFAPNPQGLFMQKADKVSSWYFRLWRDGREKEFLVVPMSVLCVEGSFPEGHPDGLSLYFALI